VSEAVESGPGAADARPKVVVSEFMAPEGLARLAGQVTLVADATLVDDRVRLLEALVDADALIVRNRTQVDAVLLDGAPRLRVVGRLGVGTDNLALDALAARGVAVHVATGANAVSVAEHVIGAFLVLARPALRASEQVVAGAWPREALIGRELAGRTLGLLGFGATARAVAHRAGALGMTVVASDPMVTDAGPGVRLVGLDELLACADALSVHAPLLDSTRGIIDADAIARMPAGAMIVDTSRGGIVVHAAVIAALRSGQLSGAAFDVFEEEPLTAALAARYAGVPGLLLTPHLAGVTHESNVRVSEVVADAVLTGLGGSAGSTGPSGPSGPSAG
jgi:(S)-sulfolactate dehydrogenase